MVIVTCFEKFKNKQFNLNINISLAKLNKFEGIK